MSRYDGLIIPRSYNEYINKTDPVAMSQALQLNNVLAQEVAAGNNKAVTSNAVNNALANYTSFFNKNISRIESADDLPEGFYTANAITNGYSGWATYFTLKINNDPNYTIQIYISQIGNLRFRRKNNGVWGIWGSLT